MVGFSVLSKGYLKHASNKLEQNSLLSFHCECK